MVPAVDAQNLSQCMAREVPEVPALKKAAHPSGFRNAGPRNKVSDLALSTSAAVHLW